MSDTNEYSDYDRYDLHKERRANRTANNIDNSEGEMQRRGGSKRSKRYFLRNKTFLIAVTVAIYATAIAMLFLFSRDLGTNIKAANEATVAQNVLGIPVYPKDYENVVKTKSEVNDGFLILINNSFACEHDGVDLVNISENYNGKYQITDYVMQANKTTLEQMDKMFADFSAAVGDNDLMISCVYRSMSLQNELYNAEIEEKGETEGSKWVARAGYSEHQSGFSFDLTLRDNEGTITEFDGKGKYAWIKDNCEKYGFIIRYPEEKTDITGIYHEPWHIRYVGVVHAEYIKANGLCFEEYIEEIKKHSVKDPLMYQDSDMNDWRIYFVPAKDGETKVPVPKDRDYEISGNNVDGFIVTVKMN